MKRAISSVSSGPSPLKYRNFKINFNQIVCVQVTTWHCEATKTKRECIH